MTKAVESAKTVKVVKAVKTAKSRKQAKAARQKVRAHKAVAVAKKQIGDPYRYGATGPNAFDCSGLVQFAWRKAGVKIPRVTNSQFARIRTKVSYKNLRPGDLMFFRGLGHVGMYVGKGKMIHSPSTGKTVRIEKLGGWRKSSFAGAVRPGL
ncbi:C40 family peptidase [Nonomuraea sp. NPDC048826]|uniref:C40 family peptidase n=1 Tax=Nonomuraea sp. NPDC048826 TaxID=3364347 RepID=UPI00371327A8